MAARSRRSILQRLKTSGKSSDAGSKNSLHQLAFDNSLQANIITIISNGKLIAANKTACKLLGYAKKEILTKNRAVLFDVNEKSFKKLLKQRTMVGHSAALVTVRKKSGTLMTCEIMSASFKGEDGVENAITTIVDMGPGIGRQKKIDNKKDRLVAHNIVIADLRQKRIDVKKDKTISDNITLAKKNQRKIDVSNGRIVAGNIILAKSRQKSIDTIKEKAVLKNTLLAQAKSDAREDELAEKLDRVIATNIQQYTDYQENFKLIFNSSSDVLFDVDIASGKIIINDAYEKEFGYKITSDMTTAKDWIRHIYPDDKERVLRDYIATLKSGDMKWHCNYRFLKADKSIADISGSGVILKNADGRAYRIIGSMQDVSKQKGLEDRLAHEIKIKENQIEAAMNEAKETVRSDLGKELHDNVNQLLGASRLYLEMAKKGGVNGDMYLGRSAEYTQTAIEEIRKLSKGLTTDSIKDLGLCETIGNLCRDIMQINPVTISLDLDYRVESRMDQKFKLTIFRIVQEHLNNVLKHAKSKNAAIRLSRDEKYILLAISDDGIGFDTEKKQPGIGISNIKSRATLYRGIADFLSQPGQGCTLSVKFPLMDEL